MKKNDKAYFYCADRCLRHTFSRRRHKVFCKSSWISARLEKLPKKIEEFSGEK